MSEGKSKYINVGSILDFGDGPFLQRNNETLKEVNEIESAHGAKYLRGLTIDEIRAGERLGKDDANKIQRISYYYFEPSEKAPDFIKFNVAMKRPFEG